MNIRIVFEGDKPDVSRYRIEEIQFQPDSVLLTHEDTSKVERFMNYKNCIVDQEEM